MVGPTYAEDASGGDAGGAWSVVAHMPGGGDAEQTVDGHGDSAEAAVDALLGRLGDPG